MSTGSQIHEVGTFRRDVARRGLDVVYVAQRVRYVAQRAPGAAGQRWAHGLMGVASPAESVASA
jgi:hypothetical protein